MRIVFVLFGFIFAVLGAIGAILPILPTVPFLLLAVFCFSKGSEKFHRWFVGTGLYRRHLADFAQKRSMPLKTKIAILGFSTPMLLLAMFLMSNIYGRLTIFGLIVFKYYYFCFKIKTGKITKEGI